MIVYALVRSSASGNLFITPADQIEYFASLTGPYIGFVKAELESLDQVPQLVSNITDKGGLGVETLVPVQIGSPRAPRNRAPGEVPPPHEALVLIRVGSGRAREVLDRVGGMAGVFGSAIVAGGFDVLVVAGADSAEDLIEVVLKHIQGSAGIKSTVTCFITRWEYKP